MCGLIGALAFEEMPAGELTGPIRELTSRMARRGPDDEGFWSDRRCALGFRRLSILDVSPAGHQPMLAQDSEHVLVFNGEIYNFREVREALAAHGHRPRSSGDAEVLLLALREWGTAGLDRLNGMFALAFYSVREQRLLLARDHAGIKPLHYARTARGIVFASQHDQIRAHPWCRDAAVDPGVLGLYLRFGFVPAPYGLHRGTRQLEPGQWLEIDVKGSERTGRFFELPRKQVPTLRGEEAIEACDAAVVAAVKRQLVSDVPIGVLLSGGIDSPLVALEAARHAKPLHAFTIEVERAELNEGDDARMYAREAGLQHVLERVTTSHVLTLLDDVIEAATEPTADYSMFPTLLVSRIARRQVKVVLSGDGGDELFWGYPSRFATTIEQAKYFAWPRPLRVAAIAKRRLTNRGAATRDVLRFDSIGRLYQRKHTLMAERDLASVFPSLPDLPRDFTQFECNETDPDLVAQWARWNEFRFHLARVLAKVDRASMHESLEVRVPLLDRAVIEVAWATDWQSCLDLRTRIGKQPLRRALARRVARQTTKKRGFEVPMADWLRTALKPLVRELLLSRTHFLGLPVRAGAIETIYARLEAGDNTKAWGLWLLLSLALWNRKHGNPDEDRTRH
ncbi:MAG: asparagine synthase (glutamine-hydrolyzing) [Deltaproteobacteria bacterium]|nr:asparagine synthase (glutamine-hydrolyzing) [Deltaproteobacteria bacterium]